MSTLIPKYQNSGLLPNGTYTLGQTPKKINAKSNKNNSLPVPQASVNRNTEEKPKLAQAVTYSANPNNNYNQVEHDQLDTTLTAKRAVRSAAKLAAEKIVKAARTTKKDDLNWFVKATQHAVMAENPAVMTAVGWEEDPHTHELHQRKDWMTAPDLERLRNSLSILGGLTSAGMVGGAAVEAVPAVGAYVANTVYPSVFTSTGALTPAATKLLASTVVGEGINATGNEIVNNSTKGKYTNWKAYVDDKYFNGDFEHFLGNAGRDMLFDVGPYSAYGLTSRLWNTGRLAATTANKGFKFYEHPSTSQSAVKGTTTNRAGLTAEEVLQAAARGLEKARRAMTGPTRAAVDAHNVALAQRAHRMGFIEHGDIVMPDRKALTTELKLDELQGNALGETTGANHTGHSIITIDPVKLGSALEAEATGLHEGFHSKLLGESDKVGLARSAVLNENGEPLYPEAEDIMTKLMSNRNTNAFLNG